MKLCGAPPRVIGHIDLSPVEMMAWLYCPIKLGHSARIMVPHNLQQFTPIIDAVYSDFGNERWFKSYVYLTAKTLWVTPESPGNRAGWHCDGYGSSDLNYIWADVNPTLFYVPPNRIQFPDDHTVSMAQMTYWAEGSAYIKTYPDKTLLRCDETVIHNVGPCLTPGWRSFVKVSVSDHRYLLEGNSINHALAPNWKYVPRGIERNDPISPLMKAGDGHYDQQS